MVGVEFYDLPCLTSGRNSNLVSYDMADLRRQVVAVDDNNNPDPTYIPDEVPQLEEGYSCRSEGITCPRRSNNLHNTNADFKNYTREEVMKMTRLGFLNFISW